MDFINFSKRLRILMNVIFQFIYVESLLNGTLGVKSGVNGTLEGREFSALSDF